MNSFVENAIDDSEIIGEFEFFIDVKNITEDMVEWIKQHGLNCYTSYDFDHYGKESFFNHSLVMSLRPHCDRIFIKPKQKNLALIFLITFYDQIIEHNLGDFV
ncbi:MAG: hypothetical protein N2235_05315 [Fischerella sp.]|nr:hypothetical protein [Fischerella sp.]